MRKLTNIAWKVIIGIMALILLSCAGFFIDKTHSGIYDKQYNFIFDRFKEPIEKVLFIFPNFDVLEITTQEEDKIGIRCDYLWAMLKTNKINIADIMIIIHNHLDLSRFSEGDINCYRFFKANGFRGLFAIYLQGTNTMIFIKEPKEK